MTVAICDDEQHFRTLLKSEIYSYKSDRRLHIDVYEFSTGDELLASDKVFDMIFLDYQMPGLDGMEVAKVLRQRNCTCSIVFVTSFPHFVYESFTVQPYRFYVKPLKPNDITDLLNTYIRQQQALAPIVVINDNEQHIIKSKDILYLEGNGKYCTIRTATNTYRSSKTLSQVHALLPQHCFFRTHKSYVVNLYSISSFHYDVAILVNGEAVNIGRTRIGEFRRAYTQFVKDYYVKV